MAGMKTHRLIPIALAGLALGGAASTAHAGSPAVTAAGRHLEGTVLSVNRDTRTFRLRDAQRGTFRIKVTESTNFDRLAGFGSLRTGSRNIEATVKRSGGRWVALTVERSGGGGHHGGGGGGAGDPPRRAYGPGRRAA